MSNKIQLEVNSGGFVRLELSVLLQHDDSEI